MTKTDVTAPSKASEWITHYVSTVSTAFIDGWLLMLVLGAAHTSAPQVPNLGYWVSVFSAYVLAAITASGTIGVSQQVTKLGKLFGGRGPQVNIYHPDSVQPQVGSDPINNSVLSVKL